MWTAVLPPPYFPPNTVRNNFNNPTTSNSIITTFSNRLNPDGYRFNKKFVKANFKPTVCARCSSASQGASSSSAGGDDEEESPDQQNEGFWKTWWREAEIISGLAELGFWVVLAFGLIDWQNLFSVANLFSLLWMYAFSMYLSDDALATDIDRGLRRIQKYFNFPSLVYAFALVVSVVAASFYILIGNFVTIGHFVTIVGLLMLLGWGK